MKPVSVMFIAGEASGDTLAAELVRELRVALISAGDRPTAECQPLRAALAPRFFGAGGPRMAAEGVELAVDLTAHAVVGLIEVLRNLGTFRRLLHQLVDLAMERQPDLIVCVDFSGFNRRFAAEVRRRIRRCQGPFFNWSPRIAQFVSPQVWASRESRAVKMARDFDLVLSIFPFEKAWYAQRVPGLRVEFVGHPLIDRHAPWLEKIEARRGRPLPPTPTVLLLPGSRPAEVLRHWPLMTAAAARIASIRPVRFEAVWPNEALSGLAARLGAPAGVKVESQTGGLAGALLKTDLAVASTGTVTMECAFFEVPTVAMYVTSWSTYQIGRRIIKVPYLAMPNLLANEPLFPELIQHAATPESIAREVLALLNDGARREAVRRRLIEVVGTLGGGGATRRAAQALTELLGP